MKKPRLDPDWKRILKKTWSVRLLVIAGVLSGLEAALPFIDSVIDVHRGIFAALSFIATGGAFVARLLAQHNMEEEHG